MVMERLVFDGEHMRATAFEVAAAQNLVVLFDHRRRERGFPAVTPSEFFAGQGLSQVKITVKKSDFFLNPDLVAARQALHDYASAFAKVSGLGFSMGGFGCLLFARAMRISQALLVSPQRPQFPHAPVLGVADHAAEAEIFAFPGGQWAGLPHELNGCVLFDPLYGGGRDRAYARILGDLLPGLSPLALPGGGHPATALLVRTGQYHGLQRAFAAGDFSAQSFKHLHRRTRERDRDYLLTLGAWAFDRADRSSRMTPRDSQQAA